MKRTTIILLILSVLISSLYSGGKKEVFPENFTLNITALNGPTGIGMIHLFENKPDLGEGVISNYNVALNPKALIGDLAKETIDIAVLPANMPALLNARNLNYKVAAVTGLGVLYVVSTDKSIQKLSDLKNKTVYNAAKGATPDFLSRFLLGKEGIDSENDLYMDFSYSHADLAKAMIGGLVETAILPEPFVTMVIEKSNAQVVIDLQEVWMELQNTEDSYPMSVLVIKQDIIETYPLLVKKFLKEYKNSINKVNAESAALVPLHGFTMTADITEKAIPRINLKFIDGRESKTILEDYYKILYDLDPKIIGGSHPGEDLYYLEK
jgi:NitT/TauT family transport system substrate-binding protein